MFNFSELVKSFHAQLLLTPSWNTDEAACKYYYLDTYSNNFNVIKIILTNISDFSTILEKLNNSKDIE